VLEQWFLLLKIGAEIAIVEKRILFAH